MGILEAHPGGKRHSLGARCLLGRTGACDVRLQDPRVSGEHASVHWTNGRWELRDLGSRNGTFLDGRRLAAGQRVALDEGSVFSLGGPEPSFTLIEARAPGASARHLASGERRAAVGGLLVLPDDERALASVFEDSAGRWVMETRDARRPVQGGEEVEIEGERFALELPGPEVETWQSVTLGPALELIHLRLAVSRDEERVEATVVAGDRPRVLPPRSYHYLLVTLARAWLNEADRAFEERGWVGRETLCRMLATDLNKLNVDIHRARKQLAALDIQGAAGLIERRQDTGEIRLGVRSVEVTRL